MSRKNVSEWLAFAVMFVFTGCAVWDQAVIAVDDAINSVPERPAEVDIPAEKQTEPETKPEPKPEPECAVPALPTQRTIERARALWKPVSESDGKLVTLLDRSLRTHIVRAEIIYQGIVYEQGRFVGDTHNGCRPHHRWKYPGSAYASGCVVAYTINGEGGEWVISYYVGDSAQRLEWGGPTGIINPNGEVLRR